MVPEREPGFLENVLMVAKVVLELVSVVLEYLQMALEAIPWSLKMFQGFLKWFHYSVTCSLINLECASVCVYISSYCLFVYLFITSCIYVFTCVFTSFFWQWSTGCSLRAGLSWRGRLGVGAACS